MSEDEKRVLSKLNDAADYLETETKNLSGKTGTEIEEIMKKANEKLALVLANKAINNARSPKK